MNNVRTGYVRTPLKKWYRAFAQSAAQACLALSASCQSAPGVADTDAHFYRFHVPTIAPESIVDFGFLNAPLTEKDRLQVCGPALCKVGTSTPVRLFGVNLGFDAVFPDKGDATQLALRLRRLGVNFVRLHAIDSISSPSPESATGLLDNGPYPSLNQESINRLRNLLQEFRNNGIYADLNLHVGYQFRPSIDKTIDLTGSQMLPNQSKPFLMIDDSAVRLQAQYASALLASLKGAGEPSLALVEVNNESSLVYAWMNGDLNRLVTGKFKAVLMEKWRRFYAAKSTDDTPDIQDVPSLSASDRELVRAFLKFLSQEDTLYVDSVLAAIRRTSPKLLTIGTQMSFGGLANFQSMKHTDVLDNHFYVDHYRFPNRMWQWDNWQITDTSNIGTGLGPLLGSAFYRSLEKPYLITEFNQPWPNRQAAEILPETAVFASIQDWSGLAFYDYTHSRDAYSVSAPREFSLVGDATKLVQFGQMAWLYRTYAIQPLRANASYTADEALLVEATQRRVTNNLATFLEQRGIAQSTLPLLARVGYMGSNAKQVLTQSGPKTQRDGEVNFDLSARQMIVDAATVKGVIGYLVPKRKYDYGSIQVQLQDSARGFLSLTLSTRDGLPVEKSHNMLLTLPGYTTVSTQASNDPAPLDLDRAPLTLKESIAKVMPSAPTKWTLLSPSAHRIVNLRDLASPIWMERVPCTVAFRSEARKLTVYPLSSSGTRMTPLDRRFVKKTNSGFEIRFPFDAESSSPWYELQPVF